MPLPQVPVRLVVWLKILMFILLFASVQAQTVAVIQMREALMATDEMKHAFKDLAMRNQPRHIQLAQMRAEVGKLIEKVSSPMFCDLCDGAYVGELHKSVEKRVKELNQFQAGLERDDAASLQSRLEPVRRRMLQIIRTIAESKGTALVLDAKATLLHPNLDLTAEAIVTYNKLHPVH